MSRLSWVWAALPRRSQGPGVAAMSRSPTARIHPTALVAPQAVLGEGVEIGAYAIIEGAVALGAGGIVVALSWTLPLVLELGAGLAWLLLLARSVEERSRRSEPAPVRAVFTEFWSFTAFIRSRSAVPSGSGTAGRPSR